MQIILIPTRKRTIDALSQNYGRTMTEFHLSKWASREYKEPSISALIVSLSPLLRSLRRQLSFQQQQSTVHSILLLSAKERRHEKQPGHPLPSLSVHLMEK